MGKMKDIHIELSESAERLSKVQEWSMVANTSNVPAAYRSLLNSLEEFCQDEYENILSR